MSQETPMNRSGEIQVDVLDLYKALTPMIASQRLEGYYTFLSYSRNRGDQRPDEEIFRDVLSDFLMVSGLIEQSIGSLDQIDKEQILLKLKTLQRGG
jgi:hypothetical protein